MASMEISAAIETAQEKKEALRKSFEAVQGFSSALFSFSFMWKDLDEHFSSIQRSIEARFKELEIMEARASAAGASQPESAAAPEAVVPRTELAALCAGMDAHGLRSFISETRKEETERIRDELLPALRLAGNPAALVYDAIEEYRPSTDPDGSLLSYRRTCLNLLWVLKGIAAPLEIGPELREKARKLGAVWMENIQEGGDDLEVNVFLDLLRSYHLVTMFDIDDVLDIILLISKRKHTVELCRGLGLVDHIPDLIQKIIKKGKHVDAVKFVFAFDLQDKFPPASLIKDYLMESRLAREMMQAKTGNISAKSILNSATDKKIGSINAVIKVVKEFNLESQYPVEDLQLRIVRLQQKISRKRSGPDFETQPRQLLNKQAWLPNAPRRPMHEYEPQDAFATSRYNPAGAGYVLPPLPDREYMPGMPHYNKPTGVLLPEGQGLLTSPPGQYQYPNSQSGSNYYERPLLLQPPSAYSYPMPGLSRSYGPPYL